jgi:hypothetical protein
VIGGFGFGFGAGLPDWVSGRSLGCSGFGGFVDILNLLVEHHAT